MLLKNKIIKIEKQRTIVIDRLQAIRRMIRGTYCETYRRCGKATCWCSKSKETKGHISYRINWTKNSKPKTKAIPKNDTVWIKEMTGNYKKWRTFRAELRELEKNLKILVDEREDEIIKRTEKRREYF